MKVTIFDPITGQILRIVQAPSDLAQKQAQTGESWVVGKADPTTQYVNGGLITDRPEMPGTLNKTTITADKVDTAIINNLPEPCTVTFKGNEYEVTDSSFGFRADFPGIYEVKVEAWPHLDAFFTVEAIEP